MKLAEDQEQEIEEIKERLEELLMAGAALLLILPVNIHVGLYKLVMLVGKRWRGVYELTVLVDKRWQTFLKLRYPPAEMY